MIFLGIGYEGQQVFALEDSDYTLELDGDIPNLYHGLEIPEGTQRLLVAEGESNNE